MMYILGPFLKNGVALYSANIREGWSGISGSVSRSVGCRRVLLSLDRDVDVAPFGPRCKFLCVGNGASFPGLRNGFASCHIPTSGMRPG